MPSQFGAQTTQENGWCVQREQGCIKCRQNKEGAVKEAKVGEDPEEDRGWRHHRGRGVLGDGVVEGDSTMEREPVAATVTYDIPRSLQ